MSSGYVNLDEYAFLRAQLPHYFSPVFAWQDDVTIRMPDALILDDEAFDQELAKASPAQAASHMLAGVLRAADRSGAANVLGEPGVMARIERLLDLADTELVFQYATAHTQRPLHGGFIRRMAPDGAPVFARLVTLLDDIKPLHEIAEKRWKQEFGQSMQDLMKGSKPTQKREDLYLPEHGNAGIMLDAREQLRKRMHSKDTTPEWLARPAVWEAVRKTSLQYQFISACISCGAYDEATGCKKRKAHDQDAPNKLLAGLENTPPPKSALDALNGYMDSITSARDLSAMAIGAREVPSFEMIQKAAERIGYSAQDALDMMGNQSWGRDVRGRAEPILQALCGGDGLQVRSMPSSVAGLIWCLIVIISKSCKPWPRGPALGKRSPITPFITWALHGHARTPMICLKKEKRLPLSSLA